MFGAIAGGIASALAGGAMSKLFGGGQKAASGGIQGDVLRSEERFSRNAETELVCRLLLEKKKESSNGLAIGDKIDLCNKPGSLCQTSAIRDYDESPFGLMGSRDERTTV